MATYGLSSPFKKSKGETSKDSPLKFNPAFIPLISAGLSYLSNRKASKQAGRKQRADQQRFTEMQDQYNAIEFQNPYEGLTNPYANLQNNMSGLQNNFAGMTNQFSGMENQFAGLTNQYSGLQNQYSGMENTMEDLRVNTGAADFAREQSQQSQANILGNLSGVAGSSGIGGLAQSLANAGTQQARQASLSIGQQERQNQMASRGEASRIQQMQRGEASRLDQLRAGETSRLQGVTAQESSRIAQMQAGERGRIQQMQFGEQTRLQGLQAGEQSRLDQLNASGTFQVDMLDRRGQQYVEQQNINRIQSMYGLSADNLSSSTSVNQQAQNNQSTSMGNLFTAGAEAYGAGAFGGSGSTPGEEYMNQGSGGMDGNPDTPY